MNIIRVCITQTVRALKRQGPVMSRTFRPQPCKDLPRLKSKVDGFVLHSQRVNFRNLRGLLGRRRLLARALPSSLDLDPFLDDLTRAKSAKELIEHLETRVL